MFQAKGTVCQSEKIFFQQTGQNGMFNEEYWGC